MPDGSKLEERYSMDRPAKEKKRVMIIGGAGLLGRSIAQVLRDETEWEVVLATRSYLVDALGYERWDSNSRSEWKRIVFNNRWKPDVIVNTAALTNVDRCESDREEAWKTNVGLVEIITEMCRKIDARLIQISSDYVFDGEAGPYTENDRPCPINYYGKTKLAAENVCLRSGVDCTIVRTMWLYGIAGEGKMTFTDWVAESLKNGETISVVSDEIGNPTFVDDVSYGVLKIIERGVRGVVNIAGPERMSRLEWAKTICQVYGLDPGDHLREITTEQLERKAERPLNSGLVTTKVASLMEFKGMSVFNGTSTLRVTMERLNEFVQ